MRSAAAARRVVSGSSRESSPTFASLTANRRSRLIPSAAGPVAAPQRRFVRAGRSTSRRTSFSSAVAAMASDTAAPSVKAAADARDGTEAELTGSASVATLARAWYSRQPGAILQARPRFANTVRVWWCNSACSRPACLWLTIVRRCNAQDPLAPLLVKDPDNGIARYGNMKANALKRAAESWASRHQVWPYRNNNSMRVFRFGPLPTATKSRGARTMMSS